MRPADLDDTVDYIFTIGHSNISFEELLELSLEGVSERADADVAQTSGPRGGDAERLPFRPWRQGEESELRRLAAAGRDLDEIGTALGRPAEAIRKQMVMLRVRYQPRPDEEIGGLAEEHSPAEEPSGSELPTTTPGRPVPRPVERPSTMSRIEQIVRVARALIGNGPGSSLGADGASQQPENQPQERPDTKPWTEEDVRRLNQLLRARKDPATISVELGRTPESISRYVKEAFDPLPRFLRDTMEGQAVTSRQGPVSHQIMMPDDQQRLIDLWADGRELDEIAHELGYPVEVARRHLKLLESTEHGRWAFDQREGRLPED